MRAFGVIIRNRSGWPLTRIRNRPFINSLRVLFLTDPVKTWKHRHFPWPGTLQWYSQLFDESGQEAEECEVK